MARKQQWSEAELRLPYYLRTYTGYMDDEANVRWSERQWRVMRNKWLRIETPQRLPSYAGEALLKEILAFLETVCSDNLASRLHDQAIALGKVLEMALDTAKQATENRRAGAAKARAKIDRSAPRKRSIKTYKVIDGQGREQLVQGVEAVAALTGSTVASIRTQLSIGGGAAWLGRRNPETSWKVSAQRSDGTFFA